MVCIKFFWLWYVNSVRDAIKAISFCKFNQLWFTTNEQWAFQLNSSSTTNAFSKRMNYRLFIFSIKLMQKRRSRKLPLLSLLSAIQLMRHMRTIWKHTRKMTIPSIGDANTILNFDFVSITRKNNATISCAGYCDNAIVKGSLLFSLIIQFFFLIVHIC